MKKLITTLIFFLIIFSIVFGYSIIYRTSASITTITVTGKDRVIHGTGENMESRYLIYTSTETYENVDSWTFIKFNSADFQGKLEINKTYKVKIAGWRIPLFNSFKNIVEIIE